MQDPPSDDDSLFADDSPAHDDDAEGSVLDPCIHLAEDGTQYLVVHAEGKMLALPSKVQDWVLVDKADENGTITFWLESASGGAKSRAVDSLIKGSRAVGIPPGLLLQLTLGLMITVGMVR